MDIKKLTNTIRNGFREQLDKEMQVDIDLACQEFRKKAIKAKNEYLTDVMDSIEFVMREEMPTHEIVFNIRRK